MMLKVTSAIVWVDGIAVPGTIIEASEAEARALIARGKVEPVSDAVPEIPEEDAVASAAQPQRRGRGRRGA